MLTRLFHAWEHRLASVSKDRLVRPFDWGLDWLPPSPEDLVTQAPAAPSATLGPEHLVRAWVDDVMADTGAFFDAGICEDYAFIPAERQPGQPRAALPTDGAGTLRFSSALVTPHPENNTVTARWFPSVEGTRGRAVVVLPQWNSDPGGHVGLSQLLARFGVSALRLSLPYHDGRMPPELTRADYIVSANVVRTVQVCRQAVLDARRAVAWLAGQGYERIGILGTSLGSCLAMLTAAHEPRIRAQALNHVSPWFADVVWRGLSTRHVRAGLDGHIDLDTLRALWRPISPFSYLDRATQTRTLLVYARYDLTFPVDLSRLLIDEFAKRGRPHETAVLPCGHYSTGNAPFKFLDAYVLTRFLRKSL
ncbi:MAG: abhydrolase domain-containing 18 [Vicinamibacterales bacterium]